MQRIRFKVVIALLMAFTVTLISGCSSVSTSDTSVQSDASPSFADAAKPESKADTSESDSEADEQIPVKAAPKMDGDTLFNLLAAEFSGNAGDISGSLNYYREASKTIEDSRIAARTAYIALYGENYDEALEALDRWRELEPDAADLSRMYAVVHLKRHEPEQAVPYIENMLSTSPASSAEKALAVKQLLAKEATDKDAYIVLQKLNERDDKNLHMLVLQSRYAAQNKHYDEALSLLDEVLIIDPSLTEVLIIKSRILSAQGKQKEASELIRQVLSEYEDNTTLRLQYARMLVEQNELEAATEQYGILHERLPDDGEIALSYALLNVETQNLDEASKTFEHLIEIDKKVPVANYYLGRIAQNKGDDKKAVSYYLRVSSGDYAYDAQLRIGVLLAVLGKPDEGLAKLEALAEGQEDWGLRVQAYLAQGEILRNEKRYKEGVEMYSRALQQNREDTTLLYARGLMAEKVDRLDMTEADLLKVISMEPENADALNALGYTLADRTSRYQEAQDYIRRAAKLVPDDPAILDSLGWVSYRLGEMEEALKYLAMAFEKLEDAEIAAHYGEVLWKMDQKDKAREIWKKGQAQNADNPVLIETLKRIQPW